MKSVQLANILTSYGHFNLKVEFIKTANLIKESLKLKAYAPIIIDEDQQRLISRSGEKVQESNKQPFDVLAVSNYINVNTSNQKLVELSNPPDS